jgi:mono/diheme cytochrome c family protein
MMVAIAAALIIAGAASAATADVDRGRTIFQRQCAPCHGQGVGDDGAPRLPGTAALERKYKGTLPPELEKRTDLTADVIRLFVCNGSGAMPMFRKPELSDAAIEDIAAYLKTSGTR